MAVIYQITNMENGKYYIGSAQSFERRTWQHKHALKRGEHKNPHMQAAWNKYGADMFVFEILETVPDEDQFRIEDTYLVRHVGQPNCYNVNTCADGGRLGIPHTEASKQKVSLNRKGKHAGPDHYRYGQEVSEETRKKIGDTQRGVSKTPYIMSEQGRLNIAAAVKRGEESHFYGKRPANADDMQRAIRVLKRDRSEAIYPSLTYMRDTFGVSIATIIRACKSGNPVRQGVCDGWMMAYADAAPIKAPETPDEFKDFPRTRQEAKELGAKKYFTGIPCALGHISPRRTKGDCIACTSESEKKRRDALRSKGF